MSTLGPLHYQPPSNEVPYYDALFSIADRQSKGSIGGQDAVSFLSLSKIPMPVLKQLWVMADQTKSNTLNKEEFIVAVRLIQLFQNQEKPSPSANGDLAIVQSGKRPEQMKPAMFEGISGARVPLPGPSDSASTRPNMGQHQPSQSQLQPPQATPSRPPMTSPAQYSGAPPSPSPSAERRLTVDPFTMTPGERQRYDQLFPNFRKQDGYVYGPEAVALFSKSGMETSQLRQVWAMVDVPVDNRLDEVEFAIAMHLIVCVTKKGLPLPGKLPPSLAGLKQPATLKVQGTPNIQSSNPQQTAPSSGSVASSGPPQQSANPSMSQQRQPSMRGLGANGQGPTPGAQPQGVGGGMTMNSLASAVGGVSISDAFAGMDATAPQASMLMQSSVGPGAVSAGQGTNQGINPGMGMGMGTNGSQQAYQQQQNGANQQAAMPQMSMGQMQVPPTVTEPQTHLPKEIDVPPQDSPAKRQNSIGSGLGMGSVAHAPQVSNSPSPSKQAHKFSSQAPAAPYVHASMAPAPRTSAESTEGASKQLADLQAVLQQLRAENVSLKAQLSSFSDDEVQVKVEIENATKEVAKLSSDLSSLREQVAIAQTSLLEATSELKAKSAKKEVLEEAIKDTKETLDSLEVAKNAVSDAKQAATEAGALPAPQPSTSMEDSLFGDYPAPTPATAAETYNQSYDAASFAHGGSTAASEQQQNSVMDLWGGGGQEDNAGPKNDTNFASYHDDFAGIPQSSEPAVKQNGAGAGDEHPMPSISAPAKTADPAQRQVSTVSAITMDQTEANLGQSSHSRTSMPPTPTFDNVHQANDQHHDGPQSSGTNGFQQSPARPAPHFDTAQFGVMGGAPPTPSSGGGLSNPVFGQKASNNFAHSQRAYAEQLDIAKANARKCADELATAEAAQFQYMEEAEQLESAAKKAEQEAEELKEKKAGKKKGVLGGKSKKTEKEIAKVLQAAEEARDNAQKASLKAAEAQKQVLLLRHESMEKNQRVEEIELDAAKEASMAQAQADQDKQNQHHASESNAGGYFDEQQPSPPANGGLGGSYFGEQAQKSEMTEANYQNGSHSWGGDYGGTGFGVMGGSSGDGMQYASPWGQPTSGGDTHNAQGGIPSPYQANTASGDFPF